MDKFLPAHPRHPRRGGADGHAGGKPLHERIAQELRSQIADGTLAEGEQLPSEHELMRRYGVSRGTVRQARAALRAEGVVNGTQGRRLSVSRRPLTQPLSELISFSAWAESLGRRPSASVVDAAPAAADAETAQALGMEAGDPVFRVVRVRLADETPLMIERTSFVPAIGPLLAGIDLATQSIYAALDAAGVTVGSARHLISAFPATRADAKLLGVAPGTPLLRVRRIGFSTAGDPIEWSDDRFRGDRVDFAIENTVMGSGMVRRMEERRGA